MLSYNLQISTVIGIISKVRHFCSKNVLFYLYNALFMPPIDNSLLAWGSAVMIYWKKLVRSERRAVRIMGFSNEKVSL